MTNLSENLANSAGLVEPNGKTGIAHLDRQEVVGLSLGRRTAKYGFNGSCRYSELNAT